MSSTGASGISAVSLAQSLATAQRSDLPTAKAELTQAAMAWEKRAAGLTESTDVADVEFSADRDADGRLLSSGDDAQAPLPKNGDETSENPEPPKPMLPPDPHGRLGRILDREV